MKSSDVIASIWHSHDRDSSRRRSDDNAKAKAKTHNSNDADSARDSFLVHASASEDKLDDEEESLDVDGDNDKLDDDGELEETWMDLVHDEDLE